ncbi:MAG: PQQ-binding-like beta-propeller repeat protein, partial [Planctomycetes bacterium]|nr:PQQ-binding-like beta-propeller repeat protein [Planctomycetota bacterium]
MTTRWLSAVVMACSVCSVQAGDWPAWRGPDQTGQSRQGAAVTSWSPDGDNLLWKLPFGGRTTPIVMGGRVYFIAPVGQGVGRQERVICLEADTGKTVWEHRFNVYHTDIVENRVGWTSVAADSETGQVYAHGTGGELFCWDRDGKPVWKVSMTEVLGRISGYGGRLMTPLIDEDRVVVSYLSSGWGAYAKGAHRYFAFDKRTGDLVWISTLPGKPLDTTYASPAVGVIGGKRMMVCPAADGYVYGLLARTGEIVWKYKLSKRGLNVSAVIDGDRVYVGHSEENYTTTEMGAVVCLDASLTGDITDTGAIWRIDGLAVGYCSPALAGDRLYVVTN